VRLEALEGFREPAIPLRLDRAHDVPGVRGRGLADLRDRAVEVTEDPADLLLEGG